MIDLAAAELALIDLGAAWRGWDRRVTADAILAAKQGGWDPDVIFREAARLLRGDDGEPSDLRNAARNPLKRGEPVPGAVAHDGAELARQLFEHRNDTDGAAV